MLTACWRKTGIFAQNLFEKASFLEIVYALLNYISRWSVLFLFCFCFFVTVIVTEGFCFHSDTASSLITTVRWKHQLLSQTLLSFLRAARSLYSFSVRDRSWGQAVFHRVSWNAGGDAVQLSLGRWFRGTFMTVLFSLCWTGVRSVCCARFSASAGRRGQLCSACSSCQFCLFVSCVFQSAWGTWWWFFHLGMSSMCSDATDC